MSLTSQDQAALKAILETSETRLALQAAFDEECARWERIAIQSTNADKDAEAKRAAAFSASYKSIMSRLLTMAKVEEPEA